MREGAQRTFLFAEASTPTEGVKTHRELRLKDSQHEAVQFNHNLTARLKGAERELKSIAQEVAALQVRNASLTMWSAHAIQQATDAKGELYKLKAACGCVTGGSVGEIAHAPAPTSGDSLKVSQCRGAWQESAKRQGFRDVVSYVTLQQLAHEICTRSPPELVRDASVPTALLEQRVVFILPDDMPRHVWFFRLKGRTGTVASQLSGNSVTDLRVPVLMDDGQLHDIQIEYLRKTPGNHSLTYVNGGSRKRLSKRRTARYPRRSVYPDGSAKAQLEAINSTITNDIGLHRTSDAKLREANAPPRFLTVATSNYFHWLCHLHANLQHLGYDSGDLGVCVFDAETEHEIRAMGMQVIPLSNLTMSSTSGAATFGSPAFKDMAIGKQTCIWETLGTLEQNGTLVFLDGDITLLTDPLALMPKGYDLVITDDSTAFDIFAKGNIGFFMASNTERMRAFAGGYLRRLHRHKDRNDQDVINSEIREHAAEIGLQTYTLDPTVFVNGFFFYEYRHRRPIDVSRVAAVHHNYISGDSNKWRRAAEYNTILRAKESWPAFVSRLRRAAITMPAWVPSSRTTKASSSRGMNDEEVASLHLFWSSACARRVA